MKTTADLILLIAALLSVFFVAGLAKVPTRVRISVAAIGPCFLLTFLLHYRYPNHVDYGLIGVGVALAASAFTGFQYTTTAPLSRKEKVKLFKRFAVGFALSAVAVAAVAALIINVQTA